MSSEEEHQYALTEAQLESYKAVFAAFDKGNTGSCSFSEDFMAM